MLTSANAEALRFVLILFTSRLCQHYSGIEFIETFTSSQREENN